MQPKELWVKLNQFLVFVFPVLHVRWPQRLQHILRYWKQDSVSPNQKHFSLPEQQNDKMTDDWNPSLSSLEVWCQRKQLRYWCFQHKSSAPVTSLYLGVVQFYNSCLFLYLFTKSCIRWTQYIAPIGLFYKKWGFYLEGVWLWRISGIIWLSLE